MYLSDVMRADGDGCDSNGHINDSMVFLMNMGIAMTCTCMHWRVTTTHRYTRYRMAACFPKPGFFRLG